MTQAEAEAVASWRYPGEYAFYDAATIPEDLAELLDPQRRGDAYLRGAWTPAPTSRASSISTARMQARSRSASACAPT